ncbi:MAG: hypothetical protein C5B50_16205 [Verrucomicrobia bacterium]|nr:MAG: hypothetical protein C5B50_16205 [Verrucomicrobiota bacterium]
MRSYIIALGLSAVCITAARADYNPVALTPGSFTQDIVVEKGAPPPLENFCNATIDQGTNNYANTFFEEGYIPNMPMFGLPAHGATFTANDNANITYQMPPDYHTNNCAFIGAANIPGSSTLNLQSSNATLTAVTPTTINAISFLYAGGGGGSVNFTIIHQDGTTETGNFTSVDWLTTAATCAWIAKGRVSLDGNAPLNTLNSSTQTKVFHLETSVSTASPVTAVDFEYGGATSYRIFVFAISGSTDATHYTPIPVQGFNADCVVEADCPVKASYVNGCNVTFDAGPANTGTTIYEQGFATTNSADQGFNGPVNGTAPLGGTYGPVASVLTNTGFPHPGRALVSGTHNFVTPSSYAGNCAVFVGNYAAGNLTNNGYGTPDYRSNTISFTSPQPLFGISFLDSSGGGTSTVLVRLNYSDGSFSVGKSINIGDWFSGGGTGNTLIWTCMGRVTTINPALGAVGTTTAVKLYFEDVTPDSTTKTINGITLSWSAGNRPFIFGISGQTNSGGTFYPLAFTGFNADPIVEAAQPLFPGGLYTATTTTMDLGLRNGNNTWFERGWVTNGAYSAFGLPPAGSTINSLVDGTRHYTLPSTYAGNNAILLDTNHTTALVTPVTPVIYSAISLLTAGASIGAGNKMTNYCVLYHADGSAETNLFFGYDWFDTTLQPAFIAQARTQVNWGDATSISAGQPSATTNLTPRVFESFFSVNNINSPVTNIFLIYGQQNYCGNSFCTNIINTTSWTTYVLAVSASQGPVQPIVANGVVSVNGAPGVSTATIYEGSNVVFSPLTPVTGSQPITYQWQSSADNGASWQNLADGGTVSGTATANMTISSAGWTNTGKYRLYACNAAGCTTNGPATLNVVSPLPDVTHPGDPISPFQPLGGSSNNGQDVTQAIIDLVGTNPVASATYHKYLNFGANGGAPFSGPIGLVVTPNQGMTTVNVLRLFTANDNQARDPIDYTLEGSNDGGNTWSTISSGPLNLPAARTTGGTAVPTDPISMYSMLQELHFANSSGYFTYRLSFTNVFTASANSCQIGEVELLGTNTLTPALIVRDVDPDVLVFRNASPTFFITAYGNPGPLSYQWYRSSDGGTTYNAISGANSASYTVNNAQTADSGAKFQCVVSNSIPPAATSSASTLTVIPAPTSPYATNVMQDGPVAYLRLNEGPDDGTGGGNNGAIAYDKWGGHNGYYTNAILQSSPGYNNNRTDPDLAAYFGKSGGTAISLSGNPDSCVEAIGGIDFAATNASANLSVEAWVMLDSTYAAGGPIGGAGIVTKGYGGGGEQFCLDTGGGASGPFTHTFRFFTRATNNATSGGSVSTVGPEPGIWHHLVGVLDEVHTNVTLYVDGMPGSKGNPGPGTGLRSSAYPVTIGARPVNANTNNNLLFYGTIDEVAIYPYALSASQVMTHFLAAGIVPRFLAQPTNTTANSGTTVCFYAPNYGSPTISNQWFQSTDGGATFQALGGANSSTLCIANLPDSANGYQYYNQASNPYGATNSAIATLTVASGPPIAQTCPTGPTLVYAGRTVSLSSSFGGTAPISYQWYQSTDGGATYHALAESAGHISGSTSNVLSLTANTNDTGLYQIQATNNFSAGIPTICSSVEIDVETVVDFNLAGAGWQAQFGTVAQGSRGFDATSPDAKLILSDSTASEATSAFYNYQLYIGAFMANFTYQESPPLANLGADGATFCIQRDSRGLAALGGSGGNLGVSGITPSWELCLNIFPNNNVGYSFNTGGGHGPYLNPFPVDLHSQDPIQISLLYDGATMFMTMTDAVATTAFSTSTAVNLPSTLGSSTAYVGFTGATGGDNSTQTISNFRFIPLASLSVINNANGTVTISWPSTIGGYTLLERNDLTSGAWTVSGASVVNNQVTVSAAGAAKYYKLGLNTQSPP